ncbi:MAG TPA: hypothetical protein VMS38_02810 [Pseudorhodoferax sp.]|nr:hypothetical protein [Pseudorhodoferax sp.]
MNRLLENRGGSVHRRSWRSRSSGAGGCPWRAPRGWRRSLPCRRWRGDGLRLLVRRLTRQALEHLRTSIQFVVARGGLDIRREARRRHRLRVALRALLCTEVLRRLSQREAATLYPSGQLP